MCFQNCKEDFNWRRGWRLTVCFTARLGISNQVSGAACNEASAKCVSVTLVFCVQEVQCQHSCDLPLSATSELGIR